MNTRTPSPATPTSDVARSDAQSGKPAVKAGTSSPSIDEIARSMIAPSGDDPASSSVRDGADPAPRAQNSKRAASGDNDDVDDVDDLDLADDEQSRNRSVTPDDDQDDDQYQDEDDDEDGSSDDDDPLAGVFDDDGADENSRDDEDDEGEPLDASKLGDDVKLSVTVDGEEQEVTLGELKRRYAGNGAIEKRLQEATEARNAAAEDYQKGKQIVEAVFQNFGQALFRRTVPQPEPELLDTNPAAYMRQKEMFDRETTALTQSHMQLQKMMNEVDAINQRQAQERRKQASQQLRQLMPVFNDPVKGPKVRDAIISAAKEIGFTDADISMAEHPLIFKTMALAARELRRQKMAKMEKVTPKERTLRGKGSTKTIKGTAQKRQQKAIVDKARSTGALDDVAATLIQPAPKKRGRRR